ncbi:MaoC family dehydratase [Hymenobacter koreensis]|uniref:MaoC family dehydratase n=1 Tax=Hymenobacter koreensis TaxID=1084523 RepID=A0ABP8IU10_9BACT
MFEIGQKAQLSKTFTDADIRTFAELSGDTNPVHLDDEFAKSSLFGRRIAHGLLTASLLSGILGTKIPGTGAIYLGQTIKFLHPVFVDDTITAEVEVIGLKEEKKIITVRTTCTNQDGKAVLEGEAVLKYA